MLDARHVRQAGPAAGGDEHASGGDPLAAGLDQEAAVDALDDPRPLRDQPDAGALQHAEIDAVEPGDLLVAVLQQLPEVEARLADVPAIAGRRLERLGEVRRVVHQLLGHAAADHAGAADPAALGQGDARTEGGGAAGAGNAARAAADDEQIDVGHFFIRCRPCLADEAGPALFRRCRRGSHT